MTSYIRGFEDFMNSSQPKRRGTDGAETKVNETKDYMEIPKDPIIYRGYYLIIWPFRNEERHPDKRWGFTVSENSDSDKEYLFKSKGPGGNYQECLGQGQKLIDNIITNEAR